MVDGFLKKAAPVPVSGRILMILSPHAGYGFSGATAAWGYKLLKDKNYKTVIIIGSSHYHNFDGVAAYGPGAFATSLGQVDIDEEFLKKIIDKDPDLHLDNAVFDKEHAIEVQLPFLQRVLFGLKDGDFSGPIRESGWKIIPMLAGDCSLETCERLANLVKGAIGARRDVLVVVSSDLYHGYDFKEADQVDELTLDLIKKMDYRGLYYALRDGRAAACGGFGLVIALKLAQELGGLNFEVLAHTNSALVTGDLTKGSWTVGYASGIVIGQEGENMLLDRRQKNKLLELARNSIRVYLETGKKITVNENDPVLNQKTGAFVTLNQNGQLRGCIGSLTGSQPLYLTVRDMAIEAAVDDPRFPALHLGELKDIEIDISVLSALERVSSVEMIQLGKHGVLVRRGPRSGVFLPQVATETGWNKEEFLNNLCAHKAGLPADAWKDKETEIYIFTADVFSEKTNEK